MMNHCYRYYEKKRNTCVEFYSIEPESDFITYNECMVTCATEEKEEIIQTRARAFKSNPFQGQHSFICNQEPPSSFCNTNLSK